MLQQPQRMLNNDKMNRFYTIVLPLLLLTLPAAANPSDETPQAERPVIALKTNLLYDAISLINVEAELPLGGRVSVAAQWVCPWWRWGNGLLSSRRHCLQMMYGNLSIKYWLNDPAHRSVMSGWYLSLYSGGGLYDFEHDARGYQGEFLLAAGLGCGYAHSINRSGSLRMEYSLGVGYLKTHYKEYESLNNIDSQWFFAREDSGYYSWFGITRADVSLVWLLSRKNFRGGVR